MKRLVVLFGLIGLVGVSAVGCGSPKPSAVVRNFYAAVEKGDMDALAKHATPETVAAIALFSEKMQGAVKEKGKIASMVEVIDGDAATVAVTYESGETDSVNLIKADGKWKVHVSGK
ncbi:MAG: DUF4878 domain-containing protein [Chitinispirillales bacterium]|jgi:ketosteroid isomerase-like protein|nr:DUF4878 domain-containing protein [Chitinispirillales bacterium]